MGLLLAKAYNETPKQTPIIKLYYENKEYTIQNGDTFYFPGDDTLELGYMDGSIEITYNKMDKLQMSMIYGLVQVNITTSEDESVERDTVKYAWRDDYTGLVVSKLLVEE
jgi:DUF4097 and DUF4098 domain-containing protein YvlB